MNAPRILTAIPQRRYQFGEYTGIVLGDILDKSLRRGLVLSDGDLTPFFTRPISLALWLSAFSFILLSMPSVRHRIGALFKQTKTGSEEDRAP